jgi:hypothetical protein
MSEGYSRRQLLRAGVVAGTVGLAGCSQRNPLEAVDGDAGGPGPTARPNAQRQPRRQLRPVDVRGAIYLPTRAFNIFQMWWLYDPAVIERDLGYATRVNLNAVRIWTSYEWWTVDAERHAESLEHFLSTAERHGLAVLVDLFEGIGRDPIERHRENTNPATAVPVSSPAGDVLANRDRWDQPREYVEWFMERYRDDDRLIGISAMNEPGWHGVEKRFSKAVFETLAANRGSVPITVGSTSLTNSRDYHKWGADILQFHYNFVKDRKRFRQLLWDANHVSETVSAPVWLTEWQRFRTTDGSSKRPLWRPDYASMVPPLHEAGVGNFFWSLMVKPAYVRHQRDLGTVSGLFHEDGAVWSLADARAIKSMSGEPAFNAEERSALPEWLGGSLNNG